MVEISIIVPIYNVESYLRRCIDSILKQTFSDFELILVDDGSTDRSGGICDEYAEKDGRVHVIHQKNSGVSAARNRGLAESVGKYVMFCDADDYVSSNWVSFLYQIIRENPNDFVCCSFAKGQLGEDDYELLNKEDVSFLTYFELFKRGLSPYVWNKIYLNKTLKDQRIRFDEQIKYSEDVKFNVAYCKTCERILSVNRNLYCYLDDESSASNRYKADAFSLNFLPFTCRLPLIDQAELQEYCDIWFYTFYHLFENVFNPRNKQMSFAEKMKYNQAMLCSEEFQYCLHNATLSSEKYFIIEIMNKKNYYLLWFVQKIIRVKNKL